MGGGALGGSMIESLSARERQVLGMAAAGMLDKQIGHELGLSLNTLRTYWQRIRTKVGDVPRTALVSQFVTEDLRSSETDDLDLLPPEGVIIDVLNGTMLASDSVNDMHGLEHGLPHPLAEYSRIYHPEDMESARSTIYDVIEGRLESAHVIFRLVPDTGVEVINVSLHGVRDAAGRVVKVYGYRVRALDCRRHHNPEVRVGSWERWVDSDEITIDQELASILGLSRAGSYPRDAIIERLHTDDQAAQGSAAMRAIDAGEAQFQLDSRVVGPDGSSFWVRTRAKIVEEADGRMRVFGTATCFR